MSKGSTGAFITGIALNIEPCEQRGLLLGYASVPIPAIRTGIHRLGAVLSSSVRPYRRD